MPTTAADAVAEATYPAHAYRVLPQRVPWDVKRLRAAYIDGGHEALADEVWDQVYSTARGRATDVWERAALIDWLWAVTQDHIAEWSALADHDAWPSDTRRGARG
ncbi:hypothetical protein ACWDTQ_04135 [Streptomyces cellulosae]|uniref:hypothetical protein n=1 Tax=Streptomyces sp. enrichment culture TaxID=1795815 RepID=UPI003F558E57